MHGFPEWVMYVIVYWPLIVGVLAGGIGQLIWSAL